MESWNEIVSEYYAAIFAYAFHLLQSKADAEDITQDTFIRARKSLGSLREKSKVKSWLYSIAHNLVLDKQRSLKRFFNFLSIERTPNIDQGVELSTVLSELINALPKRQKEVFVLRHWHGFSTEETAALLKIDQGSVKSHLSRAIGKLKAELTSKDLLNSETTKDKVESSIG